MIRTLRVLAVIPLCLLLLLLLVICAITLVLTQRVLGKERADRWSRDLIEASDALADWLLGMRS